MAIKKIEKSTSKWPFLETKAHSFGGREFIPNDREVAHIHWNDDLDILFKRELIRQRIADRHTFVPSKAVTFKLKNEKDLDAPISLMRLSYLIHAKKAVKDATRLLATTDQGIRELPYDQNLLNLSYNV